MERVKLEHAAIRQELLQDAEYLEEPLQAFRLIKRLVVDWPKLHDSLAASQKQLREGVYRLKCNLAIYVYSHLFNILHMQNMPK